MIHERKQMRLKKYDYSRDGYYYVTICVKNHECVFGKIKNSEMILNEYGEIVKYYWNELLNHYENCKLDYFIIMPNHIHGIIQINRVGDGFKPSPTEVKKFGNYCLSEIIRGFKTFSSRKINSLYKIQFQWQRSFYDHIIRDEEDLNRIREYILYNPLKWDNDEYYVKPVVMP